MKLRSYVRYVVLLTLLWVPLSTSAQGGAIATVKYARGVVMVENPDVPLNRLLRNEPVFVSDTVTTENSYAILEFDDGMRVTVRPFSTYRIVQYRDIEGEESIEFDLSSGGLRILTGALAARRPGLLSVNTPFARITVNGTEFDVRLCEDECAEEAQRAAAAGAEAPDPDVIGRVVTVTGELVATDASGIDRALTIGGPVYVGDSVRTGPAGFAVIAFTDRGVVTIQPGSALSFESYRLAEEDSESGMVSRMAQGGLRMLTGAIAQNNAAGYAINTPTAQLGVRGTGFDFFTRETVFLAVWEGTVTYTDDSGTFVVGVGQTLCTGPTGEIIVSPECVDPMQDFPGPRPDEVPVDFESLFGTASLDGTPAGLYAFVWDGHVRTTLSAPDTTGLFADLGRYESVYINRSGIMRLETAPLMLVADRVPLASEVPDLPSIRPSQCPEP